MKQMTRKSINSPRWWPAAVAALAIVLISFGGSSFAAKGGIPGKPTGGEAGNNLSAPAVQTESVNTAIANWSTPAEPLLGVHYSYGCDVPQKNESFSYPNTSCVDDLDNPTVYYDAASCPLEVLNCSGQQIDRIYWQKVDVNEWWADDDGISPDPADVAYVDWGDALEAVSWNERSVIRVETQPYGSTIDGYLPWDWACQMATDDAEGDCKVGFQMWHVAGQGITEHWGVRASEAGTSYNYDSPFQIIKTTNARLNLAKLDAGSANCPMPGEGGPYDSSPLGTNGVWSGSEWEDTTVVDICTLSDAPYSVETSVGGKYVYGFNWRMKNVELDSICSGFEKTGFWRLTFYAPEDVMFDDALAPNVAPPAVPSEVRALPRCDEFGNCVFNTVTAEPPAVPEVVVESEDPTADDRLYRPVVDTANNLTYLDICIVGKTQGGGGGGGGKPDGGGGKPGGGGGKP